MFIDNYAFNQPIIFEHKERIPLFVLILDILLALGILILIVAYMVLLFIHSYNYEFMSQSKVLIISTVIFVCFALFVAMLNGYYERFNFYYVVTFNENSFTIGFPTKSSFETLCFYRKITYVFKEKSQIVYMRDVAGIKCCFRYDENFRKFLEEIQII